MNDNVGLDKAARLKAKREQEAEEAKPQPLDPPFPYRAEPFDPGLLEFDHYLEVPRTSEG